MDRAGRAGDLRCLMFPARREPRRPPPVIPRETEEAMMMHPKEPGGWQDAQAPEKPDDGKRDQQTQTGGRGTEQQGGQKRGQAGQQR